jgi:hypothetical protein
MLLKSRLKHPSLINMVLNGINEAEKLLTILLRMNYSQPTNVGWSFLAVLR